MPVLNLPELFKSISTELPWDEPTRQSNEYSQWVMDDYITFTPWKKMDNRALSLAKKILNVEPKDRLTVDKILCQPWMRTIFDEEGGVFILKYFYFQEMLSCCWCFGNLAM